MKNTFAAFMRQDGLSEDSELLKAFRNGDENAFKILYEKYWTVVYTAVHRRLPQEEVAKDIVQNVFIKFWSTTNPILIKDSLAPYLIAAARKQAINYYRKNQADLAREASFQTLGVDELTPELSMQAKELELFIEKEIAEMPETMRKSFLLSRVENKTIKDISTELSLSEQTIKNNISNALNLLRQKTKRFLSNPASLIFILLKFLT